MDDEAMMSLAVKHCAALTKYYIEHVCSAEVRKMIYAHNCIYRGRFDTVCYITAAALAWLFTGRDPAAPFSGVWEEENQHEAKGVHRVVAYSSSGDCFEDALEHVVFVYNDQWVIDSHFARGQSAKIYPMTKLEEFACHESKSIYLQPEDGIARRLELAVKFSEVSDRI